MASAYTQAQIQTFLDFIKLPSKYGLANNPPRDLTFLTDLHTHMLSAAPYENLDLHYAAKERSISLHPQHLYQKIVLDGRGRGGYCMELSLFYNHILRGLGFDVYTAGVKIRRRDEGVPKGDFIGWVHIVNIVTLPDGTRWMVDVGFGGDGATKPLPLIPDQVTRNIGTQDIRLIRDHIPSQVNRRLDNMMWIYEYRNSPAASWNPFYAFYDVEFTEADFGVMNWFTGCSPLSPQRDNVLVIKFLRRVRENGHGEEVYGKRMLTNGTVKENIGGKTLVVQECRTESERVEALEKWFGIRLTDEESKGIRGWKTEL